jgi:flagellar hook protein FlgE
VAAPVAKSPAKPRRSADKTYMQISAIALGGMNQAQNQLENTARRLSRVADPTSNVDLPTEMVSLMQSRNDFATNAKVATTADQIEKTTIDMFV